VSYIDHSGNYKLLKDGYSGSEQLQHAYDGVENPVYIHVTTDEYQDNTYIVVQYWFLYLYNYSSAPSLLEWDHEGEWEMIEVILEYSEKIFSGIYPEPNMVAYSRHSGGETHTWENEWIEKEGYHPVAYIAYGTHAAYFKDLEWNEDLNKGIVVTYVDMNFIVLDGMEWLPFSGRWGGQENSPLGPFFQDIKWLTPVSWAMKYLDNYLLHLERPAHLLVTNEKGQKIGFYKNQFINEIQDAYVVMTDGHESYYLPQDTYSVEIDGFDDGEIDFDVIVTDEEVPQYMSYNQVVTRLTKVYSQIGTDLKEYVLTMDKNGDGIIDFTMKPHLITFNGGTYPFLVYAVAVVLTVILYKIQRKSVYFLAAMFFLLWFIAATNDLGNFEYETEFLLCGIVIFLGLQIPPAFKKQTFKEKIQRLFTGVGLSLLGMWIIFMVLLYGGWVNSIALPISIHYFLVGILFLIISYLMKSKK
ncbi:MAG: hypothetical protein HXS54_10130, partial [Theionarchaea archaeon]|nr:hypothetical protein [Theionarchaea archaeon]